MTKLVLEKLYEQCMFSLKYNFECKVVEDEYLSRQANNIYCSTSTTYAISFTQKSIQYCKSVSL